MTFFLVQSQRATLWRGLLLPMITPRQSSRSMGILAGSSTEEEAEKIVLHALKSQKRMTLDQLVPLLAGQQEGNGDTASFEEKFGVRLKKWMEQRPHLVRLEVGGTKKQRKFYVHRVEKPRLTATIMEEANNRLNEDLTLLTVKLLQERAREYGIKPGKLRKAELIELVEEHQTEMMSADASTESSEEEEDDTNTETDTDDEDCDILEEMDFPIDRESVREDPPKSQTANGPSSKGGPEFTKNQQRYRDALYHSDIPIVLVDGPAGTGKTSIACEWAASALKLGHVRRLVVTRPSVSAGEDLGYLPGTLEGKLKPYLLPIYDSLADEGISKQQLSRMMQEGESEVAPISFLRGRTFRHAVIVADEMQNATKEQMKMLLTRLGYGSRMVVTGDLQQSDLGRGVTSGLGDIVERIERQPDHLVPSHLKLIHLEKQDVKRHAAVATVLSLYDDPDVRAEKSWKNQQSELAEEEEEIAADAMANDNDSSDADQRENVGEVDWSEKIAEYKKIYTHNNIIDVNNGDGNEETGVQDPPSLLDDEGNNATSITSAEIILGDGNDDQPSAGEDLQGHDGPPALVGEANADGSTSHDNGGTMVSIETN